MILRPRTLGIALMALTFLGLFCGKPKQEIKEEKTIGPTPEGMVLVPGGFYTMGSDSADESPKHKVWVCLLYTSDAADE